MKILFTTLILFSLLACQQNQNPDLSNQLKELQEELDMQRMVSRSMENHQMRNLIHMVYFDVKENAEVETLIEEIRMLEEVEALKDLEIGTFKNLGDKRALEKFEVFMQMAFDTEEDYKTYQNHPAHLSLKKSIGKYLAGPPVTYDYIVKE